MYTSKTFVKYFALIGLFLVGIPNFVTLYTALFGEEKKVVVGEVSHPRPDYTTVAYTENHTRIWYSPYNITTGDTIEVHYLKSTKTMCHSTIDIHNFDFVWDACCVFGLVVLTIIMCSVDIIKQICSRYS